MSFHIAVVYDNFTHLQRIEFGRVRDEEKQNLSLTLCSRHSSVPAPPIKRATLKIAAIHLNSWCANFRLSIFRAVLMWRAGVFQAKFIYEEFQSESNL